MSKKRAPRRRKEISPAVLHAFQYAAEFNPPTDAVPFPPPTLEQIELVVNMTDDEQREFFRVAKTLLEEQRRRAWYAKRNKGKSAA